ncbi:ureidoglycolate dehydrogenase [Enterococcus sp. JM4C]|uniref:ureidoglycolate dehydrogenase n=1 Tax=Candidatus Enterococcus huntleyi TaxID=1857217 RepID=UPI001379E686|nr:ureidoglycolate dehydrogenase [Enterococcus sp. JM4C]KAF1299227.1 ureidoglycolate dehydrogenase [Enterococcus sp. JM4C]
MTEETAIVTVEAGKLHQLIKEKLMAAGLHEAHAEETAKHLVYADACGIHSHGAVRVDYYAERIAKGGVTIDPEIVFEKTGASTGLVHGDNGVGQYVCDEALKHAIDLAKESGLALVGVSQTSHSGALSYYVKKAAEQGYLALAMCQSDPMVVPYGGSETYFGTNPIAFSAPRKNERPIVFDMATTVQAWGKILDARSKNKEIPDTWAVDSQGNPTTNPHNVNGLLPIAGPKGYGLMMMVDILAGTLLGLPFGKHVSSMYADLTEKRNLGQIYLIIDPARFTDVDTFKENINRMVNELHEIKPVEGVQQVYYPGELSQARYDKYMTNGIPIATPVYDYLVSETIHFNQYGGKGAFAE